MKDYNRALELDPNYVKAYVNRGLVYADTGNHEAAIQDYDRAIQLDPRCTEAYYNRGLAFQSVAQMKQAEIDFKQVITLDNSPQLKTLAQKRLEQL